ncbi:MAG: hypothetical protein D6753_17100 [Planctomycetota bacterium]|nr:MAG: hypothetical protein D6753_17100 [Planctomycetota bacterium]
MAIASVDLETGIWPGVTAFFFCAVGWFILTVVGLTAGEYWARRPGLSVEVPDQGDSDKGAS